MKECIMPLYSNTNTTLQHWGVMQKTGCLKDLIDITTKMHHLTLLIKLCLSKVLFSNITALKIIFLSLILM